MDASAAEARHSVADDTSDSSPCRVRYWAISLTAWLAYLALEAYFAPLTICEFATGSSLFGETGWSLLPPGSTCTFDAGLLGTEVGPHVDGPSLDRLGIALVFVLWPLTLAWMGRSEGTARS